MRREIHVANIVYVIDVDCSNVFGHLRQQASASLTGEGKRNAKESLKQQHFYLNTHEKMQNELFSTLQTCTKIVPTKQCTKEDSSAKMQPSYTTFVFTRDLLEFLLYTSQTEHDMEMKLRRRLHDNAVR